MPSRDSAAFGKGRTLTLTILGKSGTGKTVFLSSLYSQLAEGLLGFSAAASNHRTDITLGGNIETLYEKDEVPEGTKENELKYAFSLMFEGEPIAEIDCFDYRGEATVEDDNVDSGAILNKRIASSDIIIWLIDLSEVTTRGDGLYSRRARVSTSLRRLNFVCSHAIKNSPRLRIWSFVRSKVDINFPDLTEDNLATATRELHNHLGDVVTISTFGNVSYASLVSIAPIGRATTVDNKVTAGDEAVNVEWPLLTSIGMLIKARLVDLDEQIEAAQSRESKSDAKRSFFSSAKPETDAGEPVQAILAAEKERDFLTAITARIREKQPASVILLDDTGEAGESLDA